ncbi:MAG: peptide chain release factor N(5)-glutamine methyltransferase [Burkholderiales bacterium]|nr:peptide chain release factor N(5)-glutamine methyltransferase [Burkholderiales bacterium]MCL4690846.1 peptide chain release factor N(5)-glutamine methyltransferase [Burkholderiales bacterium]
MRRTVRAALEEAAAAIGAVDARVLACHLLGASRAWLIANPMHVLTESQDAQYDSLVARRAMGMPVAYLTGTREFWGREFAVGPAVLIPRPETETLVEAALARLPAVGTALDLGSGSGAIAVTLACERPGAAVCAVDASAEALEVARANAGRHGVKVEFLLGSWYAPVAGRRFDLVVANPPYVAEGDHHLGEGDLRFEPRAALTDGSGDGLDSLRAVIAGAPAHLAPGGWLLVEHGWDQAPACRDLLAKAGFAEIASIADLAGIARVAGGRRQ